MRPTTRMMLANRGREGGNYETRSNNYGDVYSQSHADPGRYQPMDNYGTDPNSRFRDRRGRKHYDNGRFAPMRSGLEIEGDVVFNRIPPIYHPDPRYRHDGDVRMIGFETGESPVQMGMHHDELAERRQRHGHDGYDNQPIDKQTATAWVKKMHNSDGSTGEHWTYEQTSQLMRQKNIDCEPAEFYAAMNMLWSDYGRVAQRVGQDNADFWAEMAKAFLMDKDAKPNKVSLYYECIAK